MIRALVLLFLAVAVKAQTVEDCRKRFDNYLNFKNSLNSRVIFEDTAICIYSAGKKTLVIYESELPVMARLLSQGDIDLQKAMIGRKGTLAFPVTDRERLLNLHTDPQPDHKNDSLPLFGFRVALDPGHFGTNMKDALVEQKYLFFERPQEKDTIRLFESTLTFNTAKILKHLLEEKGATVLLSRSQADFTSFECTYQEFLQRHRKRTIDSLEHCGELNSTQRRMLLTCSDYDFFWKFFRNFDLANRAKKINDFRPHATAIIHYNVDEKNEPWTAHSRKDFTMAFIGGAFVPRDLSASDGRAHFLRLLITDQLDQSEKLAAITVNNFETSLEVPIATVSDAGYLSRSCIKTSSPGVFCRNLALCRKINSPLVYGESLYQDNEKECKALMDCSVNLYGVVTSDRITKVAGSYFSAISSFLVQ